MENEVNQTGRKNIYDPQFVKNLFNTMSGSYERMNYITSFGFSIRWRKQFLRSLHLLKYLFPNPRYWLFFTDYTWGILFRS